MATGTNSRSDTIAKVVVKPANPGDCISDKMVRELIRRLQVTLPTPSNVGDSVVSRTPPEDKTKIWYVADENGIPTGQQFAYNPKTGAWESTSQSIPPIPCRSTNTSQIIGLDSLGCWIVTKESITELAQSASLTISNDSSNALSAGSDGGVYLSLTSICVSDDTINFLTRNIDGCLQVIPSADTGNAIVKGSDGNPLVILPKVLASPITLLTGPGAAGTSNLTTFTTVPTWATHAIIRQPSGRVFVPIAAGFITYEAILSGESIILDGFIKAQP